MRVTLSRCSIVVARDRNGCRRARPGRRAGGDQRGGRSSHAEVRDAGARASRRARVGVDGGRRADRPSRCRRQRDRTCGRRAAARPRLAHRHRPGRRPVRRATRRARGARRRRSAWRPAETPARSRSSRSPTRKARASGPRTSARPPTRAGFEPHVARPRRRGGDHAPRRDARRGRRPRGRGHITCARARPATSRSTSSRDPCSSGKGFPSGSSPPSPGRPARGSR